MDVIDILCKSIDMARLARGQMGVDVVVGFEKDGVEYHYEILDCDSDDERYAMVGTWRWCSAFPDALSWNEQHVLPWLVPGRPTCDTFPIYVGWTDMDDFLHIGAPSLLEVPRGYALKFIGFTHQAKAMNEARICAYSWKAI